MPTKKESPYTYTVEGSKYGEFPLDMLRRDNSKAATPEDQALIDQLNFLAEGKDALPKIVRVTLTTTSERYPPNIERWESFGWRVVESDHPRNYGELSRPMNWVHHDDLRANTMRKLANEVVKLRGLVHCAEPAFNAVRYASDVAGHTQIYREQAIGYVTATQQIIRSGDYPDLLGDKDKNVLGQALEFARELLMHDEEERVRRLCDGDRLTKIKSELGLLRAMFEGGR